MRGLKLVGHLPPKDTEALVQKIATTYGYYELVPRAWRSEERSYFVRWQQDLDTKPLVIGLAILEARGESMSTMSFSLFDPEAPDAEQQAFEEFQSIVEAELIEQNFVPIQD